MDLLKKSIIIFTLICVQHVGAALTKFEKQRAMILQGHLKRLAERSKRKPLPVSVHKGVDAALKSLEMLEKKDPELHSAVKNAATVVESIQYVAPVQTELEQQARNQKIAEQERRDAKIQLKKRKNAALRDFRQHLALLQDDVTWENKKPADEWIKKVLVMLRNPELMGVEIEPGLNVPSALLERLSNTYNHYIFQLSRTDKKAISDQFKQAKNNFLQTLTGQVLTGYFEQLSKAGNFWDGQAVTINKVWLNELLQFLCYTMRSNFSDINVQQLKRMLKNVVTKKFEQENAAEAESLATVKSEIDEFLNKCQQGLQQKEQAHKGPLQKIETQFMTLMNIIGAAPRTEETEKTYENSALAKAKEWLNIVPVDQLNAVVEKIKGLYKDALKKQVTLTGFKKLIFSEKPTAALEASFNKALDDFVATKIEAVAKQNMPEQPVQQEQKSQMQEQKEQQQQQLPGEKNSPPIKQPSVQVPPITTNPKAPVITQTVPTTVSQPPVGQQPLVGEKVVGGEK